MIKNGLSGTSSGYTVSVPVNASSRSSTTGKHKLVLWFHFTYRRFTGVALTRFHYQSAYSFR